MDTGFDFISTTIRAVALVMAITAMGFALRSGYLARKVTKMCRDIEDSKKDAPIKNN